MVSQMWIDMNIERNMVAVTKSPSWWNDFGATIICATRGLCSKPMNNLMRGEVLVLNL